DAREPVGHDVGGVGRCGRDARLRERAGGAGGEVVALGALGVGLVAWVDLADAWELAHVAVLARRHGAPGARLAGGPGGPLGVGIAKALEVLAARGAQRVGPEEAHVVAAPAELARPEVRPRGLGRDEVRSHARSRRRAAPPEEEVAGLEVVPAVAD